MAGIRLTLHLNEKNCLTQNQARKNIKLCVKELINKTK